MVLGQFFCRFTGSAAQLEHTACVRRHGPQLVSNKFLEEIFAGTNFRELVFDCENRENFCLAKISRYTVFAQPFLDNPRTVKGASWQAFLRFISSGIQLQIDW